MSKQTIPGAPLSPKEIISAIKRLPPEDAGDVLKALVEQSGDAEKISLLGQREAQMTGYKTSIDNLNQHIVILTGSDPVQKLEASGVMVRIEADQAEIAVLKAKIENTPSVLSLLRVHELFCRALRSLAVCEVAKQCESALERGRLTLWNGSASLGRSALNDARLAFTELDTALLSGGNDPLLVEFRQLRNRRVDAHSELMSILESEKAAMPWTPRPLTVENNKVSSGHSQVVVTTNKAPDLSPVLVEVRRDLPPGVQIWSVPVQP